MALLIEGLAAKHDTPPFPPHVTLATAPGPRDAETRGHALAWLRSVCKRSQGSFMVSLGVPEAGKTRHQCVLSPIRDDGVTLPLPPPSLHLTRWNPMLHPAESGPPGRGRCKPSGADYGAHTPRPPIPQGEGHASLWDLRETALCLQTEEGLGARSADTYYPHMRFPIPPSPSPDTPPLGKQHSGILPCCLRGETAETNLP